MLARAAASGKPVVAAFLGADPDGAPDGVTMAATLEDAARLLVRALDGRASRRRATDAPARDPPRRAASAACCAGSTPAGRSPTRPTCCSRPRSGRSPRTPTRRPPTARRGCPTRTSILDLGDDRFTVGRPHPMIDPAVRLDMLRAAGDDPRTAVIVLDVVLGHLAADDPAADLAPVIAEIAARDDAPRVVCFVVGTDADPQDLGRQERALRDAGARPRRRRAARRPPLAETLIADGGAGMTALGGLLDGHARPRQRRRRVVRRAARRARRGRRVASTGARRPTATTRSACASRA